MLTAFKGIVLTHTGVENGAFRADHGPTMLLPPRPSVSMPLPAPVFRHP